jgi:hypothetical protein
MKKNNMKNIILLTLAASFFLLVQAFSVSAINVTCSTCNQGNCNCNVAACPSGSGMLSIYKTQDCSGPPGFNVPFTGNTAVWYPDSFGAYFGKALCDDRVSQSPCNRIDVLQTSTVPPSSCSGQDQTCCTVGDQCQSGLSCQSGTCTTTSTSTSECGGQGQSCCNTGDQCQSGFSCQSGTCTTTTSTGGGGGSDLGLWLGIIIVILIVAIGVYFLLFKKKKSKSKSKASYEDLYRKWSR